MPTHYDATSTKLLGGSTVFDSCMFVVQDCTTVSWSWQLQHDRPTCKLQYI